MEFSERLAALRSVMAQKAMDAAVVCKPANVRYLTGFTGSNGTVVVSPRKAYFLTDFRYKTQAEQQVPGFQIEIYKNSLNRYLKSLLKRVKSNTVGFEPTFVSQAQFEKWSSDISATWISMGEAVENLRTIKDQDEIAKIRRAADIADGAFAHILSIIKPQITERDIAVELEYFMRKLGAQKNAFDPIVASGRRSALPHASSGVDKIERDAFLVLDFGAVYEGYCSDMTRTVFVGKPKKDAIELYNAVLESQEKALKKVATGVLAGEIDSTARSYLGEKGLSEYFGHNLGHGVGLEIHEAPTIGAKSNCILQPGMVFTIEPGVYIENMGGVRIEDLVVLGPAGIEILTRTSKEFFVI